MMVQTHEDLARLEAHLHTTIAVQVATIRRLRRQHCQILKIVKDVNALSEVFSPSAYIEAYTCTAKSNEGYGTAAAELRPCEKKRLFLTAPPCCENGTEIDDFLFGSCLMTAHGSSQGSIIDEIFLNCNRTKKRSKNIITGLSPETEMPLHGAHATHRSLHDHVMSLASSPNILTDKILHRRLLAFSSAAFSAPPSAEKSGGANSDQLQLASFKAILPLCADWLVPFSRVNQLDKLNDDQPLCPDDFVKAEAAFVLIHEGVRQFQASSFCISHDSEGGDSCSLKTLTLNTIWSHIVTALRGCQKNEQFMLQFVWPSALDELIGCLVRSIRDLH